MKTWVVTALSAICLSACAVPERQPHQELWVGMANPASVFCLEQGGQSLIRRHPDGSEYGVCRFADGSEIEEWAYFRARHRP